MKRFIILLSVTVITLAFCAILSADGYRGLNSRAAGLGGAYVALGEGSLGAYYNPACLAGQKSFDLTIGITAKLDNYINNDMVDDFNDLSDLLKSNNPLTAANDYARALVLFNKIQNQVNPAPYLVNIEPDVAFGLRFANFGLYAASTNYVQGSAYLDTVALNTITNDIHAGTSYIAGVGIAVGEIGIGAGFNLGKLSEPLKCLDLGLNLKGIGGTSKNIRKSIDKNLDDFAKDDLEVDDIQMDNIEFSADLGLRYTSKDGKFIVGLSAKNLTSPKIDSSSETNGGIVKIKPSARIGICWKPFERITFVADADIIKNKTTISGIRNDGVYYANDIESQKAGIGLELRPFNWKRFDLPFRFGYQFSSSPSNSNDMITAGIGLKFLFIKIDVAAGIQDGMKYEEREKFINSNISLFW